MFISNPILSVYNLEKTTHLNTLASQKLQLQLHMKKTTYKNDKLSKISACGTKIAQMNSLQIKKMINLFPVFKI